MRKQKCPFCDRTGKDEKLLCEHIEREHSDGLKAIGGVSPLQALFDSRNGGRRGSCIMCRKSVPFNEKAGRYERLCSRPETSCREKYRSQFRERMVKKFGKEHLLDDPEQQRKMLANRGISGTYEWRDGTSSTYTGSYERDFLEFMDVVLEWNPSDVISPAPQTIVYEEGGVKRVYIPDFYLTSYDLIVEVKGSSVADGVDPSIANTHDYRERERVKEIAKEAEVKRLGIRYFKIVDKDYDSFMAYLVRLKDSEG
jgi:hypothetical protein